MNFYLPAVLALYIGGAALLVLAWRASVRSYLIAVPLGAFALSEMRAGWPSTIEALSVDSGNIEPAVVMATSFLVFVTCFLVVFASIGATGLEPSRFLAAPFEHRYADRAHAFSLAVQVVVLVAIGTYLYRGIPPLIDAIRVLLSPDGTSSPLVDLSVQRASVTKGHLFEGDPWRGQGLIRVLMQAGWTYVVVSAVAMYRRTRRRGWLVATGGLLVLAMAYVGGVGERSPMVTLLLSLLFALSLMVRIRARHVVCGFTVIAAFAILVAPLSGRYTNVDSMAASIVKTSQRVFLGNGTNNIWIVNFSNDGTLERGWGRLHLEKVASALPGVKPGSTFSNRLIRLRPDATSNKGNASPTYFGLLYADFGPFGTVIAYGAIGLVTAFVQVRLFRRRKNVANVALMTGILTAYIYLSVGTAVGVAVLITVLVLIHCCDRLLLTLQRQRPVPAKPARGTVAAPPSPVPVMPAGRA